MKARLVVVLIALLGASAFAPAPFPRPSRKADNNDISLTSFQGIWRVEAFATSSSSGNHAKRDWHIKYIRVKDDQWSFMNSLESANVSYTIAIDSARRPATLDFFTSPKAANEIQPRGVGIIRRTGDKVFIIYVFGTPDSRAASFERPPDNQWVIWLEKVR
jgi:hypothetical protein